MTQNIRWANFSEAWETGVKDSFWNSVFVTSVKVPVGIVLESMAAFALTHMHFKWANRVFTYILIGLIVPMQMTLAPLTC
jgi:raffinose/stachyose/melibiose transport system permease protein